MTIRTGMLKTKPCKMCGEYFRTDLLNNQCCSEECSLQAAKMVVEKARKKNREAIREARKFFTVKPELEFIDRSKKSNWVRYMLQRKPYFKEMTNLKPSRIRIKLFATVLFEEKKRGLLCLE
jgi:hypothetical protein